jgi:hypothetical protein
MNGRRPIALPVALLVLALSLPVGLASPVSTSAEQEQTSSAGLVKWAVILSPGQVPKVPWGGYHVTIAGYSVKNGGQKKAEFLVREYKILFNGKPWYLHGTLPALENWKGTWTQVFPSRTLDELGYRLEEGGFDKIKGPLYARTPWHISLLEDKSASKSEIKSFEQDRTEWYLWLAPEPPLSCREDGTGCPPWDLIN